MDIIIYIFAGIGVIVVVLSLIGTFLTGFQPNEKVARAAITGIIYNKNLTYKELWEKTYGDKEIICLEDLTYEQMIEMIRIGNKL